MLHLHSRLRSPMVGGAHPPLSPAASQAGLGSEAARLEAARARERISPNQIRSFPVTQTAALAKIAWTSQSLVDRTRVANRASSKTVMQGYYLCRRVQQSRARRTGRRRHGRRPRESTHTILPHNHVRERLRRSGGMCVILSGKISGYCEKLSTHRSPTHESRFNTRGGPAHGYQPRAGLTHLGFVHDFLGSVISGTGHLPSTPASPTCPLRSQGTAMAIASRTRAHVPSSLTIPHDLPCMAPLAMPKLGMPRSWQPLDASSMPRWTAAPSPSYARAFSSAAQHAC